MPNPRIDAAPTAATARCTPTLAPQERASTTARNLVDVRNTPSNRPARTWGTFRHAVGNLFSCTVRHEAQIPLDAPFSEAALEAWVQGGEPSEQRSEAARCLREFMRDPESSDLALSFRNLHLRALPPLSKDFPATLIDAFGNPLRTLPTHLPFVTSLWIDLDTDKFPQRRHAAIASTPPFRDVPHLEIGRPDPWREEHIPLHLAVAMWFPEESQCRVATQWNGIWLDDFAQTFAVFLQKLARGADKAGFAESRESFRASVASWLSDVRDDDRLLAKTFEAGAEAAETCSDHAILGYLAMRRLQTTHAIDAGLHDGDLPGLLHLARGVRRQEHLERIALGRIKAFARAGKKVDDVEVALAYLARLGDDLQLPFTVRAGRWTHKAVSNVSDADLRHAKQLVLEQEADFSASLDAWPPWQRRLERWDTAAFEAAKGTLVDWTVDGTLDRRAEARLLATSPTLIGDVDARRESSISAMAALEHEAYGPLTRAFLAQHGLSSATAAFKDPAAAP